MENFRGQPLDGEWWAAKRPNDHYKGVLLLDEEHNGSLTLRGTEDQLASLPIGPVQQTFFGRLENKYPYEVSLFNVGLRRGPSQTFPKKLDQETNAEFFTNKILIGGYVESEEKPFLNGAPPRSRLGRHFCLPVSIMNEARGGGKGTHLRSKETELLCRAWLWLFAL
jgi:hypothetical protein